MASLKDFLRNGLTGTCENTYQYDPFIKGTFFAFIRLPEILDLSDFEDLFPRTVLAVTLPTPTITELEAIGLGGLRTLHPGQLSLGNDLPIRLRDTYELKVIKAIGKWHDSIRSYSTGLAQIEPRSSNYKGTLDLIITSPSGKYAPFGVTFIGVWPTTNPLNALGADINDVAIAEVDATFKFDLICKMDPTKVKKYIQEIDIVDF